MNTRDDVIQLLDRFYQLFLKERIRDAKTDAEWNWFTSRLRDSTFQKQQAEQYLEGLERSRRFSEQTGRNVGLSPSNREQLHSRRIVDSTMHANSLLNSNSQFKQKSTSNKEDTSFNRGVFMLPTSQPKLDKRLSERVDTETRYTNASYNRNAQKENLLTSASNHSVGSNSKISDRCLMSLQGLLKTF